MTKRKLAGVSDADLKNELILRISRFGYRTGEMADAKPKRVRTKPAAVSPWKDINVEVMCPTCVRRFTVPLADCEPEASMRYGTGVLTLRARCPKCQERFVYTPEIVIT